MGRFLVYRNGSNAANQSRCNKLAVAIVVADSACAACRIAEETVMFYANQTSSAVAEENANVDDWNFVSEMAACGSDDFFVS